MIIMTIMLRLLWLQGNLVQVTNYSTYPPKNCHAPPPFHADDYFGDNDDDYVEMNMVARKHGQSHLLLHLPLTNCNSTSSPLHGDDYFRDNMIIYKIIGYLSNIATRFQKFHFLSNMGCCTLLEQ